MTNKEYRTAKERHESAPEIYEFEQFNGFHYCRHMSGDDIKTMRAERKEEAKNGGFYLDGCGIRAIVLPVERGAILKSYNTQVACIIDGELFKMWEGYSVTTMKHVNAFCALYGLPGYNKREWIALDTVGDIVDGETGEVLNEIINAA